MGCMKKLCCRTKLCHVYLPWSKMRKCVGSKYILNLAIDRIRTNGPKNLIDPKKRSSSCPLKTRQKFGNVSWNTTIYNILDKMTTNKKAIRRMKCYFKWCFNKRKRHFKLKKMSNSPFNLACNPKVKRLRQLCPFGLIWPEPYLLVRINISSLSII